MQKEPVNSDATKAKKEKGAFLCFFTGSTRATIATILMIRSTLRKGWQIIVAKVRTPQETFSRIYHTNAWNSTESRSGVGSTLESTRSIRAALPSIFRDYGIRSILDLPCGDFYWMRKVDLGPVRYIGGDIVPDIIANNRIKYAREGIDFRQLDILRDDLPKVDLIMVRDLFNHFPTRAVQESLARIERASIQFLLVGHYDRVTENGETHFGGNRLINFRLPPFGFPPAETLVSEDYEPHRHLARSMALWKLPIKRAWSQAC